jgi:acetolactate synthase-1/2/3 large subunit
MPKQRSPSAGRRRFLQGATLAGASVFGLPRQVLAEQPAVPSAAASTTTQIDSGGDLMVDVLKSLGLEFIATNPASSFRGLHESIINYGGNRMPELLTCTHEELAVAMAQGYAKMAGKPMGVLVQGVVGLQHAAMALYNAWCDRVPVYVLTGNIVDADKRSAMMEWTHSAIDPGALVRDFVKWDDQPASLQHFAESAVRAYKLATTPPMAPVMLSLDAELQESPIAERAQLRIPRLPRTALPQGDSGAVAEVASLLVAADSPVILADRVARTPAGMDLLVELAETLQCAVVDLGGRSNFPSRHALNQTFQRARNVSQADVLLGLELTDFWGQLHSTSRLRRQSRSVTRNGAKTISIGCGDLFTKSNYQDAQRFAPVDLSIAADAESTLPSLIDAVKRLTGGRRSAAMRARGRALAATHQEAVERARSEATIGWDSSPITVARLCAELYKQIRAEDWSLVGTGINMTWPQRLWNFDAPYRWNGGSGGFGVGYAAPGALGAALANRAHSRLTVTIQSDGDLLYGPGVLWTAAHHRIPILYVMHNNRAYHQELMYVQSMANRMSRGIRNAHVGTVLADPNIDFAMMARSFGVYAEGPITDPKDLGAALGRAIAVVKDGEPALVDAFVEPR